MEAKFQAFTLDSKVGSHPGRIDSSQTMRNFDCLVYDKSTCETITFADTVELARSLESGRVHWLALSGDLKPTDIGALTDLGFNKLALEDINNGQHRAKYEEFAAFDFWITRIPGPDLTTTQLSLLVRNNLVVSIVVGEDKVSPFVRNRIEKAYGRIRSLPANYLAYALIDICIDMFFRPIEVIADLLEGYENTVVAEQKSELISSIHATKKSLTIMRKLAIANRDMLSKALASSSPQISKKVRPYMRDGKDHTLQQIEEIDICRDTGSNLMDLALSLADHNANETMRFLTVIASIFIPLTFIAGIYGMNFNSETSPYNMPELNWVFGYPAAITLMAAVALGLLVYFRQRKWI